MAAHTYTILRQSLLRGDAMCQEGASADAFNRYFDLMLGAPGLVIDWDSWSELDKCRAKSMEMRSGHDLEAAKKRAATAYLTEMKPLLKKLVAAYRWQRAYPCYEAIEAVYRLDLDPTTEEARKAISKDWPLERTAPVYPDDEEVAFAAS